eukprot:m.72031 g.72031  ORF g.72031 m.72031 type:complete len:738 (+) comp12297_c0_seq3:274-2487(+)
MPSSSGSPRNRSLFRRNNNASTDNNGQSHRTRRAGKQPASNNSISLPPPYDDLFPPSNEGDSVSVVSRRLVRQRAASRHGSSRNGDSQSSSYQTQSISPRHGRSNILAENMPIEENLDAGARIRAWGVTLETPLTPPVPADSASSFEVGGERVPIAGMYIPLPHNWEFVHDAATGRPYFVDHNTFSTQIEDPRPLPQFWEQKVDSRGWAYFVDHLAKKSYWRHPCSTELPPSWQQIYDENDQLYYVNHTEFRSTRNRTELSTPQSIQHTQPHSYHQDHAQNSRERHGTMWSQPENHDRQRTRNIPDNDPTPNITRGGRPEREKEKHSKSSKKRDKIRRMREMFVDMLIGSTPSTTPAASAPASPGVTEASSAPPVEPVDDQQSSFPNRSTEPKRFTSNPLPDQSYPQLENVLLVPPRNVDAGTEYQNASRAMIELMEKPSTEEPFRPNKRPQPLPRTTIKTEPSKTSKIEDEYAKPDTHKAKRTVQHYESPNAHTIITAQPKSLTQASASKAPPPLEPELYEPHTLGSILPSAPPELPHETAPMPSPPKPRGPKSMSYKSTLETTSGPNSSPIDCFLLTDNDYHPVIDVCKSILRKKGYIIAEVTVPKWSVVQASLNKAQIFVCFLTSRFMQDINMGDNQLSLLAFKKAMNTHGSKKFIPVVLEPGLRDVQDWTGLVAEKLQSTLYIDLSNLCNTPGQVTNENNYSRLLHQINQKLPSERVSYLTSRAQDTTLESNI